MSNTAILAEGLGKCFGHSQSSIRPNDTLKSWLASSLRRSSRGQSSLGAPPSGKWVLKEIDFTIQRGERVGIIGGNGAGKSTLLRLLSRIYSPTTGSYALRGRVASLIAIGAGFLDDLTGRENIHLYGSLLGMSRREIFENFEAIVEFAEIGPWLESPLKHYSTGMRARLGFSVAVHSAPDIFLIDETLSVGDQAFQNRCKEKISEWLVDRNGTLLFVSHCEETVRELCDRVIYLRNGRIAVDSDPSTSFSKYHRDQYEEESRLERLQ